MLCIFNWMQNNHGTCGTNQPNVHFVDGKVMLNFLALDLISRNSLHWRLGRIGIVAIPIFNDNVNMSVCLFVSLGDLGINQFCRFHHCLFPNMGSIKIVLSSYCARMPWPTIRMEIPECQWIK